MAVLTFNPFTGGFDVSPALAFPGTLVIASGKTATINNTLTLAGTDGTTMTFPTTSATVARTDAANAFAGVSTGTSWNLTTPIFTTSATGPIFIGGAGTTSTLTLRSTSGVGAAGADIIFQVGNSGATEAARILNSGKFGIGTTAPSQTLTVGAISNWTSGADVGIKISGIYGVLIQKASNDSVLQLNYNSSNFFEIATNYNSSGGYEDLSITPGGGATLYLQKSGGGLVSVGSTSPFGWSTDLKLFRNAGAVLGLRDGANPQRLEISNTTTTVLTAGEWAKVGWASNVFRFGAVAGSSSGTNRAASWDYGDKLASATAAITVPATSGNIVFGGGVQLSNAAATGLAAGVLAATTNATIVLFDSTGQAYRVPCII